MPDSFILRAADGSTQVDVATFTRAEGIDFGTADLVKAHFVEGPHTDGVLSHEEALVRRMSFPLILGASRSISNLGLEDQEALLRKLARPGATLDLKPQGATTAVRFDVLAGRYDFDYSVHHNREGLRTGRLRLETRPFGYWPTMILLASAASVGLPGALTWAGSVIGDAPGLAKISVQPTVASTFGGPSWMPDFVALALTHRASHQGFLSAANLSVPAGGSIIGEAVAPASQSLELYIQNLVNLAAPAWTRITGYNIASALEPAYRGRYRAYGWFRLAPSQAVPWYVSLDAAPEAIHTVSALASYAPVATIPPAVASGAPGAFGAQPSPGYTLLDLGELALPPVASGFGGGHVLRLWMNSPTVVGVATPIINVGGLYVLPLDSDFAGIMPRGLAQPSILSPSAGRLMLDAVAAQALVSDYSLDLATANPLANAWQHYRGPLPRIASAVRLDLLGGARKTASGATGPVVHTGRAHASVSLSYRPRFQFIKGL